MVTPRIRSELAQGCRSGRWTSASLLVVAFLFSCIAAVGVRPAMAGEGVSEGEKSKDIVLKWLELAYKEENPVAAIDKYAHPDILIKLQSYWKSPVSGAGEVRGKDDLKKHFEAVKRVLRKKAEWSKIAVDEVIAEGHTVAVRGARIYKDRKSKEVVTRTVMVFYKLRDGKISEIHILVAGPPGKKTKYSGWDLK